MEYILYKYKVVQAIIATFLSFIVSAILANLSHHLAIDSSLFPLFFVSSMIVFSYFSIKAFALEKISIILTDTSLEIQDKGHPVTYPLSEIERAYVLGTIRKGIKNLSILFKDRSEIKIEFASIFTRDHDTLCHCINRAVNKNDSNK